VAVDRSARLGRGPQRRTPRWDREGIRNSRDRSRRPAILGSHHSGPDVEILQFATRTRISRSVVVASGRTAQKPASSAIATTGVGPSGSRSLKGPAPAWRRRRAREPSGSSGGRGFQRGSDSVRSASVSTRMTLWRAARKRTPPFSQSNAPGHLLGHYPARRGSPPRSRRAVDHRYTWQLRSAHVQTLTGRLRVSKRPERKLQMTGEGIPAQVACISMAPVGAFPPTAGLSTRCRFGWRSTPGCLRERRLNPRADAQTGRRPCDQRRSACDRPRQA
jgi:hypothetical protein